MGPALTPSGSGADGGGHGTTTVADFPNCGHRPAALPYAHRERAMSQIVVVSGNPRAGSRTSVLAIAVGRALADGPAPVVVEVGDLGAGLLTPGDEATAAALGAVRAAEVLVIATPT